jgi:glucosamine--fructose-6-phosphate aminotransferase (isomerizing)
MCGIVGYVGTRPAVDLLLQGLKRLEYRGYDSAGVALLKGVKIEIEKSEGKLERVEKLLNGHAARYTDVVCGIGHTRWATHGKPTTQNAHPHRTGHVVLVHNGIIENYQEIKKELIARGHVPQSQTDSELFGFLVLEEMEAGKSLVDAVRFSFLRLHGQCSVVVMSEREPGLIVGVRNGSPMVVTHDPQGGMFLASDAQPLLAVSRDVIFLEHGDVVVSDGKKTRFLSLESGQVVDRVATRLDWSVERLDKQGYAHYMLKEIFEQPTALIDTLNGMLDRARTEAFPLAAQPGVALLDKAREIVLVACGTSWHAALVGKYWLEKFGGLRATVELASEFRYASPVVGPDTLVITISQSGETADILAVVNQMKGKKVPTLGITNVRNCTLSREADAVFYTSAGPEIGVAATKTFSAQLMMMILMSGYLARKRGDAVAQPIFESLIQVPSFFTDYVQPDGALAREIQATARAVKDMKGFFFIGRGTSFPLALEGALKLKEIAYVHAEGYAAGELKHGPIAMIEKDMVVVVIAPRDLWRDKTVSNLEEVKARGGHIIAIGDPGDHELQALAEHWLPLPACVKDLDESLLPFLITPIVQLLSYELAVLHGTDVDQPRNLAKSVTVE